MLRPSHLVVLTPEADLGQELWPEAAIQEDQSLGPVGSTMPGWPLRPQVENSKERDKHEPGGLPF